MPHAVLNTGAQTGAATGGSRELVPGIQPGGSRVGAPMKPALLLQDVNVVVNGLTPDMSAGGPEDMILHFVMSQESSLVPHLLLPILDVAMETETAAGIVQVMPRKVFMAQGTIWCPAYVGWRILVGGSWGEIDLSIHVDYEVVQIPWMDWFLRWDFLDNTPTGQLEY